jgi:hypothetical protein
MRMDLPTTGPRRHTGRIQRGGGASTVGKMLQDQPVLARRVPDAECANGLLAIRERTEAPLSDVQRYSLKNSAAAARTSPTRPSLSMT